MEIKPLRQDLKEFIRGHNLDKKWQKAKSLFEENIKHPSLHVELLEPHWRGVYSFRLDRKLRALFFISTRQAEIFQITKHYKKG
ncbi:MAG: hypothetical protein Athens071426_465 [Parcubacteria group bacterium Athens0714_26]|nr:MAG: hypothetical protein Athens101426_670 [Parcubacteria group bacterium Athens1014_26]TSD02541.1 MAG: hypothetical protein Athens071426_465 [Parcubacteria group bacterium Athens0714_26]